MTRSSRGIGWLVVNILCVVAVTSSAVAIVETSHRCRQAYAQLQGLESRQWDMQEQWGRLFQFADGRCFTGCVVISPDREAQYGTTGSLLLWELVDPKGLGAEKLRKVLELAAARVLEERVIRKQWGITEKERAEELRRFRQGLERAAQEAGRFQLPPDGFSMETVTGWFAPEH